MSITKKEVKEMTKVGTLYIDASINGKLYKGVPAKVKNNTYATIMGNKINWAKLHKAYNSNLVLKF